MPPTTVDGVSLHYETEGSGEPVVFVPDAGFGAWQWAWQYDVDRLAADLEAVLGAVGTRKAHLVGAGLGGMIALRYARQYDRARTLSLFGTAPTGTQIDERAFDALYPADPTPAALSESLQGAFSEQFRSQQSEIVARICDWRTEEDAAQAGLAAQEAAMTEFDAGPLYELTLPVLVCHGLADPVVDVDIGRQLAEDLPGGSFEPVEGKRLCHIEHARAVTDRIDGFLAAHSREA